MAKRPEPVCTRPEEHHQHLCELQGRLTKEELAPFLRQPKYVCANCGGRTAQGKNLCRPVRIRK